MPVSRRRRGGIAVIVGVSSLGLLGFLALALDIGYARAHQAQLHAVTDAAALAGVTAIGNTDDNGEEVRLRARAVADMNQVGKQPVVLDDADIEIGVWDAGALVFTPALRGDAVRVTKTVTVQTFFAEVLGWTSIDVARGSVARQTVTTIRCGIIGANDVRHWGTAEIDSYASDLGPYGEPNEGDDAGLCSNGTIAVGGNATVWGDAAAGPESTAVVSGSAQITGTSARLTQRLELPELDWSAPLATNDNASMGWGTPAQVGAINNVPNSLRIGPGTYYTSDLTITGQGSLEIVPPVELWVDGDADLGGTGVVNLGADPSGFTLHVRGNVDMHGTSDFYGTVIAPESTVLMRGTADFYGAVLANALDISGTGAIHQDLTLDALIDVRFYGAPRLVQ